MLQVVSICVGFHGNEDSNNMLRVHRDKTLSKMFLIILSSVSLALELSEETEGDKHPGSGKVHM